MPGLISCREEFGPSQALAGARIMGEFLVFTCLPLFFPSFRWTRFSDSVVIVLFRLPNAIM